MAINLKAIQPNKPKIDISEYFWVIMGVPKGGKTSLLFKITQKQFNGDVSKLLLCAFEHGYTALAGIHAVDINQWEDFQEVVDQLIAEKDELPYRFVGLDTLDIMWQLAEDYIVKKRSIKDKTRYNTISDIPWGQGWNLVAQEVSNQIQRLVKSGFGIFGITHTKEKKFETRTGVSYDKYTATLSGKARELFIGMADFVLFLDVTKEKDASGNLVDKRYIYFRSDGTVEAGSRFANVPEKIEYDVDKFFETFETAILSEYGNDYDALQKAREEQRKQKEEEIKKFIEQDLQDRQKNVEELKEEIKLLLDGIDTSKKKVLAERFQQEVGTQKIYDLTDVEQLKKVLEIVKSV